MRMLVKLEIRKHASSVCNVLSAFQNLVACCFLCNGGPTTDVYTVTRSHNVWNSKYLIYLMIWNSKYLIKYHDHVYTIIKVVTIPISVVCILITTGSDQFNGLITNNAWKHYSLYKH